MQHFCSGILSFCSLLITILLCCTACNQAPKQNALHPDLCKPFKEGLFKNEADNYRVKRSGNAQIEYDLLNEMEYHFEVHWLYDCAYNLIFKHSTNPSDTFMLQPDEKMRVQFTEINADTLFYEVEFGGKVFGSKLIKLD